MLKNHAIKAQCSTHILSLTHTITRERFCQFHLWQ